MLCIHQHKMSQIVLTCFVNRTPTSVMQLLCGEDRSMFTSEMSECRRRTVTIYDVDESALVALVNFAYTACITLTTDNVQTLLYACSILQVHCK